jgi:hypothetical protein
MRRRYKQAPTDWAQIGLVLMVILGWQRMAMGRYRLDATARAFVYAGERRGCTGMMKCVERVVVDV